jgi:hypothetical protein
MPEIYTTMANKAIKDLNLVKAQFIVILPDGTTFDSGGDLIVLAGPKKEKKPKQERKMPHGAYSTAYKKTVEGMKVGDVEVFTPTTEMVANGVTITDLQGAISGIAHGVWGNDAHKTHMNKTNNCVELMRTA